MKTLYVSDLDCTLLGPDSQISPRSREMLNEAIHRGALFSIATARTPATVAPILEGVDINIPAVVMTGVSLWNRDTGRYHNVKTMSPEVARRTLDVYRRHGLPTYVYTLENHDIQIYHLGELSPQEREFMESRRGNPYKEFHIGVPIPDPLENTILFYALQPTERARVVFDDTRKIKEINPLLYHDFYGEEIAALEAFPAAATKANAVRELAREVGADRIVAFGDNINDLTMLRAADVAVAVENAIPEVREMADIVIGPNTEDSVARFILSEVEKQRNSAAEGGYWPINPGACPGDVKTSDHAPEGPAEAPEA